MELVGELDGPDGPRAAGLPVDRVARGDVVLPDDAVRLDVVLVDGHLVAVVFAVDVALVVPDAILEDEVRRGVGHGARLGLRKGEEGRAVGRRGVGGARLERVDEALAVEDGVELVHVEVAQVASLGVERDVALVVDGVRRPVGEHAERVPRIPLGALEPHEDEDEDEPRRAPRVVQRVAVLLLLEDLVGGDGAPRLGVDGSCVLEQQALLDERDALLLTTSLVVVVVSRAEEALPLVVPGVVSSRGQRRPARHRRARLARDAAPVPRAVDVEAAVFARREHEVDRVPRVPRRDHGEQIDEHDVLEGDDAEVHAPHRRRERELRDGVERDEAHGELAVEPAEAEEAPEHRREVPQPERQVHPERALRQRGLQQFGLQVRAEGPRDARRAELGEPGHEVVVREHQRHHEPRPAAVLRLAATQLGRRHLLGLLG
mmetsp:Transcript_10129/g.41091  ORF Transcript_10129/g.41091 Transcript_10129/m.41091 type:complete len:432 (+) Transcript_10129:309-1604(+)